MKQVQNCTYTMIAYVFKTKSEERGYKPMKKKMYVDVTEVCEDWGVSRAQGYKMIKQLNEKMLAMNPNLIVLSGKANRKFYEENCYGMAKEV